MAKKDIRIRKMGAAGSANTVYPVFFLILNSLLHYSTFKFLVVIYRNTKYRIMHYLCPSPLMSASPPYMLFGGLLKVCNHKLWSDAQCDLNQIIKDSMIGAHSPELKIPIRRFDDEIEIVIDPLRQFVSHFPAYSSENRSEAFNNWLLHPGRVHCDSPEMKHFVCVLSLRIARSFKMQNVIFLSFWHHLNCVDLIGRVAF